MNKSCRSIAPAITAAGALAASGAVFAFLDYPVFAHWGSPPDERDGVLSGDELIPEGSRARGPSLSTRRQRPSSGGWSR